MVILFLSGMGIGALALAAFGLFLRWHKEEKDRKEERLERLEKWSYDNERGLSRLTDRVKALEEPKEGK